MNFENLNIDFFYRFFLCFKFFLQKNRFGKRASNNNNFGDDNSAVDLQSQPQQQSSGEIIENGPYRWLLINRDQPLTKLTEVNSD